VNVLRCPTRSTGRGLELALSTLVGRLLKNTSVRFYVVPVDDLAVMVTAFETRCACYPSPRADYDRGSQIADDSENELRDWAPELDGFLGSLEFVES
jgi:hypothetical protein